MGGGAARWSVKGGGGRLSSVSWGVCFYRCRLMRDRGTKSQRLQLSFKPGGGVGWGGGNQFPCRSACSQRGNLVCVCLSLVSPRSPCTTPTRLGGFEECDPAPRGDLNQQQTNTVRTLSPDPSSPLTFRSFTWRPPSSPLTCRVPLPLSPPLPRRLGVSGFF